MKINIEVTEADLPSDVIRAANSLIAFARHPENAGATIDERMEPWQARSGRWGANDAAAEQGFTTRPTDPITVKRGRPAKAASPAPAEPEQQTELPVEEPAQAPVEPASAPVATPAAAVPSAAETKAAAANLALVFGGEVQLGLVKHISLTFKDADGGPARLHTLTDEGRAQFFATVKECAALADKDAILKHLAV